LNSQWRFVLLLLEWTKKNCTWDSIWGQKESHWLHYYFAIELHRKLLLRVVLVLLISSSHADRVLCLRMSHYLSNEDGRACVTTLHRRLTVQTECSADRSCKLKWYRSWSMNRWWTRPTHLKHFLPCRHFTFRTIAACVD
jgi:hypothetical protein